MTYRPVPLNSSTMVRAARVGLLLSALLSAHTVSLSTFAQDGASSGNDAPSDSDRAAAQVLFDQGRTLAKDERWEEACVKFAESMRLDRAIGTQLNVANCYEKIGKTASAWINYVEAATRSRKEGQDKRAAIAKERADALEPTLSRLRIDVPFALDGLVIKRDGNVVGAAQHNLPLPIDPGKHRIEVSAPGKRSWHKSITVADGGALAELTIPTLRDAPKEAPVPGPAPVVPADDGTSMRAAGFVIGGVGVAGLALGIAGGVLAMNKNDSSLEHCLADDIKQCDPEGAALRKDAFTMAHLSTAGFALAGVGLVTAVVLIAAAPSAPDEAADDPKASAINRVSVGPLMDAQHGYPSGLILQGSF